MIFKREAKAAIEALIEDLNMLLAETWEPDFHSINASLNNAELIQTYLQQKEIK